MKRTIREIILLCALTAATGALCAYAHPKNIGSVKDLDKVAVLAPHPRLIFVRGGREGFP